MEDEAFTSQTIERMAEYASADSNDPIVRSAADEATAMSNSRAAAASAIWQWIRRHVRFRSDAELAAPISDDPDNAEVLIRPVDLLRMRSPAGDCDDFSMLCAAMLLAAEIPASFRTVAADPKDRRYSHVYVVAQLPGGNLPLDCSHGPYPGWEVKAAGKVKDWRIENRMKQLGEIDWGSIVQSAVDTTGGILKAQYGQPNLKPGTYIQTPNGVMFAQQPGAAPFSVPSGGVGGTSSSTLILLAAAAVVLILVLKK